MPEREVQIENKGESDRREFMKTCGRYALTVPPAMTVLLSTSLSSPAIARSTGLRGNNGVGNGFDPQPPGNPPVNDGPGTGPGNPGNRSGNLRMARRMSRQRRINWLRAIRTRDD